MIRLRQTLLNHYLFTNYIFRFETNCLDNQQSNSKDFNYAFSLKNIYKQQKENLASLLSISKKYNEKMINWMNIVNWKSDTNLFIIQTYLLLIPKKKCCMFYNLIYSLDYYKKQFILHKDYHKIIIRFVNISIVSSLTDDKTLQIMILVLTLHLSFFSPMVVRFGW